MPAATGNRPRKWCSAACRRRTNYARMPKPPRPTFTLACPYCDCIFTTDTRLRKMCLACASDKRVGRQRPCEECGSLFWPTWAKGRFCDRSCASIARATAPDDQAPRGHGARQRALQMGADVEPINRLAVFERDGWLCGLCERSVDSSLVWPDPWSVSLDHIVPIALGGAHTYLNVQCSHLRCNIAKGATLYGRTPAVV